MVAFAEFDNRGVHVSVGVPGYKVFGYRIGGSIIRRRLTPTPYRPGDKVAKLESTVAIRFGCQSLGRRPKAIARNQLDVNALRWLAAGRERDTTESPVGLHVEVGREARPRVWDFDPVQQIPRAEDCRWNCLQLVDAGWNTCDVVATMFIRLGVPRSAWTTQQ